MLFLQFFFKSYMHSLIVFASGSGTNAQAIIDYFKINGLARVSLVVCNKPGAGVLQRAKQEGIPTILITRQEMASDAFITTLQQHNPSLIVLAGFLMKIPVALVSAFAGHIVNIHPALLPGYGGKGMYGHHVHEAVITAGEKESGITIHYVDEVYDNGAHIMQANCPVTAADTPELLAQKIHKLEHFYYPRAIHYLLDNI